MPESNEIKFIFNTSATRSSARLKSPSYSSVIQLGAFAGAALIGAGVLAMALRHSEGGVPLAVTGTTCLCLYTLKTAVNIIRYSCFNSPKNYVDVNDLLSQNLEPATTFNT